MTFSIGDKVTPYVCHFPINAAAFYAGITKDVRSFERIGLQMEIVAIYPSTEVTPELIMVRYKNHLYAPMPAVWFKCSDDPAPIGPYDDNTPIGS